MKFLLTLIAALLLATTADARTRDRQAQAQWQVQAQGQAQAQSTTVGGSTEARLAPGYGAPSLAASDEACMGSSSAGGGVTTGVIGVSATIGTTWVNADCNRRMNAQQLRLAGARDAALILLANDPEVRAALVATGHLKPDAAAPQALAPEGPGDKHSGCSGRFVNRAGEWFKAHC